MMRTKNMIAAAAIAVALTTVAPSPAAAQGCAGVVVGSEQKLNGQFTASFSATGILDIDITALFVPGTVKRFGDGEHTVEVRIHTPRGYLYQSIAVPFSSDPARAGKSQRIDGYPHPIPVQAMKQVKHNNGNFYAVSARLPVGGTMISANSLYGAWSAEVYVDGEPLRCSQPTQFTINP